MKELPLHPPKISEIVERIGRPRAGLVLPLAEVVSNAWHSIADRPSHGSIEDGIITIRVSRDYNSLITKISVCDNGIGLNDKNFDSFCTPYSGHKLSRGGKGFGRFVLLAFFEEVDFISTYKHEDNSTVSKRKITWCDQPTFSDIHESDEREIGTRVELHRPKREKDAKIAPDELKNTLIAHFASKLLTVHPQIRMYDDGEEYLIAMQNLQPEKEFELFIPSALLSKKKYDSDFFDTGSDNCRVKLFELPKSYFAKHTVCFLADDRLVEQADISERLAGFSLDTDCSIVVFVESEKLDEMVNTERTQFNGNFDRWIYLRALTDEVVKQYSHQMDKERAKALKKLEKRFSTNPSLRPANLAAVFKSIPMSAYSQETKLTSAVVTKMLDLDDLATKSLAKYQAITNDDDHAADSHTTVFEQMLSDGQEKNLRAIHEAAKEAARYIDSKKSNILTEYVLLRKYLLDYAQANFMKVRPDGKSLFLERELHDFIYPRKTENLSYADHNLWLIDDRLSIMQTIRSDLPINPSESTSGNPDIALYDKRTVLGLERKEYVVAEFKRPRRDDYSQDDSARNPIRQVALYVEEIRRKKEIITDDNNSVPVTEETPFHAYIIADIEPTLKKLLKDEFKGTAYFLDDIRYAFAFDAEKKIHYEIIPYEELFHLAKLRNAIFFQKLGLT